MATIYSEYAIQSVEPKNGKFFRLEELQAIVGGYIEVINLRDDKVMIINEEGKLMHLPYNHQATILAHSNRAIFPDDVIVGNALVCEADMVR